MADDVFSAARLRGYRVLEAAGLGEAVALAIQNTLLASHLWLPISLIEIAFRNAADNAISSVHVNGEHWLVDKGHRADGLFDAVAVEGSSCFLRPRSGGGTDDPIGTAARFASQQLGRDVVSRDDIVAHLMFGFWTIRAPESLKADDPPIDVFEIVSVTLGRPDGMNSGEALRERIVDDVLPLRNRVAHHESLPFRAKHIFDRKTGEPKQGNALVDSVLGGIAKFERSAELIFDTAVLMAPMAREYFGQLQERVSEDLQPLKIALVESQEELRRARDARRAAARDSDT